MGLEADSVYIYCRGEENIQKITIARSRKSAHGSDDGAKARPV